MVIRGASRGNGKQLANYLLAIAENDSIRIVEVAGGLEVEEKDVRRELHSMSLTTDLSKGDKGLFHAQINPAYGEGERMTNEDWLKAADILGRELGLEGQRRVIVLHEKKGRIHAHVTWERYDLEKKKLISDSFSRLAQDRARQKMEQEFEQVKTPHRNVDRPEIKEALTALWQRTETGKAFMAGAEKLGFTLAQGVQKRPFMVIDKNGRSFDLVKQLRGIGTRQVRERLVKEKLGKEKDVIASVRKTSGMEHLDTTQEKMLDKMDVFETKRTSEKEKETYQFVTDFANNKSDAMKEKEAGNPTKEKWEQDKINHVKATSFDESGDDITQPQKGKKSGDPSTEKERLRQEAIERMCLAQAQRKKDSHEAGS